MVNEQLLKDLKVLGIQPTDTVLVHSSLSALGYVEGDLLHVFTDDEETAVLRRMTDDEYAMVAGHITEKDIGIRF